MSHDYMRQALDLARQGRASPVRIPPLAPYWCATAKSSDAASTPGRAASMPKLLRSSEAGERARGADAVHHT